MFDVTKIKGYSKLADYEKDVFHSFCRNFYSMWEEPEKHAPIKVKREESYLRVTLNDGDWLHVLGNGDWY
ncbi:conserved hypothetical protein [Clostridiaceae bacterium BL-3]|nr:conserved hypothetical protein [Clostridiaceae bacterium BL-3]